MLLLLYLSCVLAASTIRATEEALVHVDDVNDQKDTGLKDFWKVVFTTYYNVKGTRNEITDNIVESFFEHEFEAYPTELYPVFRRIFVHISKSNDRIWNFFESILYLYHNIATTDSVYEAVLRRLALGKLLKEAGELDIDAAFPLEDLSESEYTSLEHRSGVMLDEESDEGTDSDEEPCEDECGIPPLLVGSIRAIPGEHFPNYDEIPITNFTCAGKHIPGFYADLDTGCQVFHVCFPHRRESFLCPIGTIFNQAILACDYWYSVNCSISTLYLMSSSLVLDEYLTEGKDSFVDHLLEQYHTPGTISTETRLPLDYTTNELEEKKPEKIKSPKIRINLPTIDWTLMIKFLPIKSKITEWPDLCETPTTAYPTKSTTEESTTRPVATPTIATKPPQKKYTRTTTRPVATATIATEPPKKRYTRTTTRPVATPTVATVKPKDKYEEKSEILLDILKAVKVLTKDAEGFLTEILQKKREQHDIFTKKPTVTPQFPTEKSKPVQKINQRFVVKPTNVKLHLPKTTVSRNKSFRKAEPAKLVLGGLKAIERLFN